MTEERMLEVASRYTTRSWYSALCLTCGKDFYCRQTRHGSYCSTKCLPGGLKGQTGSLGPNWKGGRIKTGHGYIVCSGHRDHPRSTGEGVVLEHVLVMEKFLGRYLTDKENVHHKNGIRDDNRIENLELWTSYQPSGQRVEDLIDFVVKNYPAQVKAKLVS